MVTGYTVENDSIIPGESRNVSITIKNTSPSKPVGCCCFSWLAEGDNGVGTLGKTKTRESKDASIAMFKLLRSVRTEQLLLF